MQHRLMMFVCDKSLLSVFMPLKERAKLLPNFRSRLCTLLLYLGVEEQNVLREFAEMEGAILAKTASPSVLGSMNDLTHSAKDFSGGTKVSVYWISNYGLHKHLADH